MGDLGCRTWLQPDSSDKDPDFDSMDVKNIKKVRKRCSPMKRRWSIATVSSNHKSVIALSMSVSAVCFKANYCCKVKNIKCLVSLFHFVKRSHVVLPIGCGFHVRQNVLSGSLTLQKATHQSHEERVIPRG